MKKQVAFFFFSFSCFIWCDAQYNLLLKFNNLDGSLPIGSLILSGNVLFGTAGGGGANGEGCVYSINTDGTKYKDLLDFNGPNGSYPAGSLILSGSILYGTTSGGNNPNNYGNIFSIDTNGNNFKDLLDFNIINGDEPGGGSLTLTGNTLYGMTYKGGGNNNGLVFSIHTDGSGYKDLLDFNGANGALPQTTSFILSDNLLYGMTCYGGTKGDGNIFSIDTDGSGYRDLFEFEGGVNGANPFGYLTLSGNVFYGMTCGGGIHNFGNIFSIDTDGTGYTDLFDFNDTNGITPFGSFIISGNILYGCVQHGAVDSDGCIFSINTNGTGFTDMFDFNGANGNTPSESLYLSGNTFYGTTLAGGNHDYGVIFSFKDTNLPSSLNDIPGENGEVMVFPNPTSGMATIVLSGMPQTPKGAMSIKVYNVFGQLIYLGRSPSTNHYSLDLSGQPNGVYLYRVESESGETVGTGKIVVTK